MRLPAIRHQVGKVVAAGLWIIFPVVPLLAEDVYYELCNHNDATDARSGPDPYEWTAVQWVLLLGPLFGYGFLAGATWGVGDEAGGRWWRSWASRRAVWVGLGPWLGLWTIAATLATLALMHWAWVTLGVDRLLQWGPAPAPGPNVAWVIEKVGAAWLCLGWAPVAWAALRRARRGGRRRLAWCLGLGLGVAFVGSLLGGYWIITTAWRGYFFDSTIVP